MGNVHGNQKTSKLPYLYGYCLLVENGLLSSAMKRMPSNATVDSTNPIQSVSYDPNTPSPLNGVKPLTVGGNRYVGRGAAAANMSGSIAALALNIGGLHAKDRPPVKFKLNVSPLKPNIDTIMNGIATDLDAASRMAPMARKFAYRAIVRRCVKAELNPMDELDVEVTSVAMDLIVPDELADGQGGSFHTPPTTAVMAGQHDEGSQAPLFGELLDNGH